jgi:hypothetical protein
MEEIPAAPPGGGGGGWGLGPGFDGGEEYFGEEAGAVVGEVDAVIGA